LPEHVDALLSDLVIETEEASQLRESYFRPPPESPRSSLACAAYATSTQRSR
jgi:hypothetical protein